MKLSVFCLLLTFSLSTLASSLELSVMEAINFDNSEVVTGERKADIIKALSLELQKSKVSCTWNQPYPFTSEQIKSQVLNILNFKSLRLTVNNTETQPIIKVMDNTVLKPDEILLSVTTSSDFKSLLKIDLLRETVGTEETNIGTILEPNYVFIEMRKELLSGSCIVKKLN